MTPRPVKNGHPPADEQHSLSADVTTSSTVYTSTPLSIRTMMMSLASFLLFALFCSSYIDISRLKGSSSNNLGDGPDLGFTCETSADKSPIVVTAIHNNTILPTTTSIFANETEFQVGSIICFVNNEFILGKTSAKVLQQMSSSAVHNISYCNNLDSYDDLKNYGCFGCNPGFCAYTVGFCGPLTVSWIYNRTLLPQIQPGMAVNFKVGCIISICLESLIDVEGIMSVQFVSTVANM